MPKGLNVVDMAGQRFGRLTALERVGSNKHGSALWRFRCDCGAETEAIGSNVRKGITKSCGCYGRESSGRNARIAHTAKITHGASYTKLYRTWGSMHGRCYNENQPQFPNYGGRGIKVCARWHDFAAFAADMGEKPTPAHTLDRIDVDGDYMPENCRWATMTEQNNNKRDNVIVRIDGHVCTLAQAIRARGLNSKTVHTRLHRGWSMERALA